MLLHEGCAQRLHTAPPRPMPPTPGTAMPSTPRHEALLAHQAQLVSAKQLLHERGAAHQPETPTGGDMRDRAPQVNHSSASSAGLPCIREPVACSRIA